MHPSMHLGQELSEGSNTYPSIQDLQSLGPFPLQSLQGFSHTMHWVPSSPSSLPSPSSICLH